ncbi:MAG TPA: hypothetical protein VEY12_13090 [Thermoplasmata archaeon]|nr:hypothetical protein [Thermoplasmata archaeon]
MARRKRKEDVPVWEPPEFDEVGYMRKEIENAKISVVVIAWAIVGAILFYLFYALSLAIVGFLLGLFAFAALYFLLPMVGLPIHGFKRRDWASHAMVYFFSWLAFTILLLNPPFGNHTSPVVGSFQVGTFNTNATTTTPLPNSMECYPASPSSVVHIPRSGNNTMYVIFRATDNVGIRDVHVSVGGKNATASDVSGKANACLGAANPTFYPNTYAVSLPNAPSAILVVTATDTSGLATTETITINSP